MTKIFLSLLSFALSLSVATASLTFDDALQTKRNLRSGPVDLSGFWSTFSMDGKCVQKIPDPDDPTSDKVKFLPCDTSCAAQMWKFDKEDPNPNYMYGGLLYNMEGGCMAVRGAVAEGKNLKVVDCNRNNPQHHWLSDGDSTSPRDTRSLCMAPASMPINNRDPVVLLKCEDTFSLDY